LQNEGIGYTDLDELLQNPSDLEFIIELFSIELPEQSFGNWWANSRISSKITLLRHLYLLIISQRIRSSTQRRISLKKSEKDV